MVHIPRHSTHLVLMKTDEEVMCRLDSLVAQLEQEGYPFPFILQEMQDYLEICDELSRA